MGKLARNAILTAMALALSVAESFIPLGLVVPVPGLKLGFANIITMFVLFIDGAGPAAAITTVRCVLAAFFTAGSLTALSYSLAGGLLSLLVMIILKLWYERAFSLYGISIAGAAAHNTAQIIVASFLLNDNAVFFYLPVLLAVSLVTGTITATLCKLVLDRFQKPDLARFLK